MPENKSVLFATPCYGGMVTKDYVNSALGLSYALCSQIGLEHEWFFGSNESLIQRARNIITSEFLKTQHSHLMFIDADMRFTPDDVAKIWNLCEGEINADIGVGVYAMKVPDKQWYAAWIDGELVKDLDQFKGPIKVDYAGTGFMMIKRQVIEALTEKLGTYEGMDGSRDPALFMCPLHNDMLESEDYFFCRNAREDGFSVWMDPSVRLGHIGQFTYGG